MVLEPVLLYKSDGLKSDHFGIEIQFHTICDTELSVLKSDHFGIEISVEVLLDPVKPLVKIRPFWDWNWKKKFGEEVINYG